MSLILLEYCRRGLGDKFVVVVVDGDYDEIDYNYVYHCDEE